MHAAFLSLRHFSVFGPLGEELLFRVLDLRARPTGLAEIIALAYCHFFSCIQLTSHLAEPAPDGLAMAQFLFTLPMGIVFAATLSWSLTASRSKAAIRTPARPGQRKNAEQDSCLSRPTVPGGTCRPSLLRR